MSVTGRLGKIRTLVLDTYTNLRYKRAFDTPRNYVGTWVPALDLDRLTAYRVLAAYQTGCQLRRPFARIFGGGASHRRS